MCIDRKPPAATGGDVHPRSGEATPATNRVDVRLDRLTDRSSWQFVPRLRRPRCRIKRKPSLGCVQLELFPQFKQTC